MDWYRTPDLEIQVKSGEWKVDFAVRCIGAMEERVNTERESIAALFKAVRKPEVGCRKSQNKGEYQC